LLVLARRFPSPEHTADATAALVRFSGIGYIAVSVLVGSGLINSLFLVGSVANLGGTRYGQLLLLKLLLFGGMLTLAVLNRFRLVPSLQRQKEGALPAESSLRMLRRNVIGEQVLGLTIALVVGWLGTLQPGTTASE